MTLSYDDIQALATHLYDTFVPTASWDFVPGRASLLSSLSFGREKGWDDILLLKNALATVVTSIDKAYYYGGTRPFPSQETGSELTNSIAPAELLDYFYRNANVSSTERADFLALIERDGISNETWLTALGLAGQEAGMAVPPLRDVLLTAQDINLTPAYDWPALSLGDQGISQPALDLLIAIYIGSFSRAPENEGLQYWAGKVAGLQADGLDEHAALVNVASMIFDAGYRSDGETGGDLTNAQYVTHLYQNVLGRDITGTGEGDYWVRELNSGAVERSTFLHRFLDAALKPDNPDAAYVNARVLVARYAAQEALSGPEAEPIDLYAVLNGVSNMPTAFTAVQNLLDGKFDLPASTTPTTPAARDILSLLGLDAATELDLPVEDAASTSHTAIDLLGNAPTADDWAH